MAADKWRCEECKWCGADDQLLRAPNPFSEDGTDEMIGCPDCREPNTMRRSCDHTDCWLDAGCGTPTPAGYRWTCFEHRPGR